MTSIVKIYKKASDSTLGNIVIDKQLPLKKIKEETIKVCVFNNLISYGDNIKKIITDNSKHIGDYIILNQTIIELQSDTWPQIDKYDNIIEMTNIVYEKGVSLITEKSSYGIINYIQIEGNLVSPIFILNMIQ